MVRVTSLKLMYSKGFEYFLRHSLEISSYSQQSQIVGNPDGLLRQKIWDSEKTFEESQ